MKIKAENIDKIIQALTNFKNELKSGESFEYKNNELKIISEFIMPKKWYLNKSTTDEEVKIVQDFSRATKINTVWYNGSVADNTCRKYYMYGEETFYNGGQLNLDRVPIGYKLITHEQFSEYLKEKRIIT